MPIIPASYVPPNRSQQVSADTPTALSGAGPASVRTYLIVGASRGIGLALVKALLARHHQVIAVVRSPNTASQLWPLAMNSARPHQLLIRQCDVSDPASIDYFMTGIMKYISTGGRIDRLILNAGILDYGAGLGAMKVSWHNLMAHLNTNCTGLIVTARRLLELNDNASVRRQRKQIYEEGGRLDDYVIGAQTVFISSDSGSAQDFREYEDGFAAYAASKAALNMMLRHMAAELRRVRVDSPASVGSAFASLAQARSIPTPSPEQDSRQSYRSRPSFSEDGDGSTKRIKFDHSLGTPLQPWQLKVCILAMHPGEVQTDMANIDLPYEVEGVISPEDSVENMLKVLEDKDEKMSGTFWRWDGNQHPW